MEWARNEHQKLNAFWYPSVNAAGAFVHMSNPIEVRQSLSKYTEPAKEFVHNYIPDNELIMSVLDKIGQGTFSLPLISQNITSIDATVTWPVFTGGKRIYANKIGKTMVSIAEVNRNQVDANQQSLLIEAYFGLRLGQSVVDVKTEVYNSLKTHYDQALKLEQNGMINRAERLFAQVSMDEAKRELESARKDLAVAQQAFKSLINMEEGSDVRTTTPLFINEALPPAQYFKDLVPMNNYIVNQLKLQQVVADNQLKIGRSAYVPNIALFGKQTLYADGLNYADGGVCIMAKAKKDIKKVVLAYSGGLDTSIIIPWLKENYNNCEVIAVSADVGQGTELDGLEEKAVKTGASKLIVLDLKKTFVEDYIFPTVQAGAVYENRYLLGTSFARPIIGKELARIALEEGADAICHGATGKGNDQVRFELAIKAYAPDMAIIAPWREWTIKSRDEEIDYAEAHNIPLKINRETNYSKDKNLWHLSHEGLDLEDPANEPQYEKEGFLELGVSPIQAPDKPTYVTIHFEKGIPTAIDGKEMGAVELVEKLNELGGANGIGLADLVENRLVGMKSRGVYETPGGTILYHAHDVLETITLDKETARTKQYLSIKFADIVYNGQWYTPLREALTAFVNETQKTVTGDVKLKLYKGNIINAGVTSPYTLYDEEVATFDAEDVYNQKDAEGFINLFGLPIHVKAVLDQKRNNK